ncbi:MAG: hypothetical protein ABI682_02035 [Acidobacteriota bacterium]
MPDEKPQSWWQTAPGLLTAVGGTITALAGLVATLHNAGCFLRGGTDPVKPVAPIAAAVVSPAAAMNVPNAPASAIAPAPEEGASPSIFLRYTGDPYGCVLSLQVRLGKKMTLPTSNLFEVHGVKPGVTSYVVGGSIGCTNLGTCIASGQGRITIRDGAIYDVIWRPLGGTRCGVEIREAPTP